MNGPTSPATSAPAPTDTRGLAASAKTVGALLLLGAMLPPNLALTAVGLARSAVLGAPREVADRPRTILINGGKMTKALQLARSFHRAGHRVILAESAKYRFGGHRFSRCVDRFYVIPSPQSPGYAEALRDIVIAESVDVFVPVCSPVASHYDAEAKKLLSEHCEVIHADPDVVERLDDKYAFATLAASLGLSVPDSHLVTRASDVTDFDFAASDRSYILKSIAYDPVRRLDLTKLSKLTPPAEVAAFAAALPVSESNPWIMQEFIEGQEFCTHSTVRDGKVQVFCCCESSAFQVNYAMTDNPEIRAWVETFLGALNVTGQVSFDFIQAADGRVYAIECNPRTHSAITMFYNHPGVAAAYLEDGVGGIEPLASSRPTYWLYHELWRALRHPGTAAERFSVIAHGKEAVFDWTDPLPFLLLHHLQIPLLLLAELRHGKDWMRIDFNIGKLVEPAGD